MIRLVHGDAYVDLIRSGAMIADAAFHLSGRAVRPFFKNPWRDDPRPMDTLTRHLGAEWPCVPFGVPHAPDDLPDDWRVAGQGDTWNTHAHGHGAHHLWSWAHLDPQTARARITYPPEGPIASLERQVALISPTEIKLSLAITPRETAQIGLGLHPVLSLADALPQTARLEIAGRDTAWTFPRDVEQGRSHLAPDQRGISLSALRRADGSFAQATHVPFDALSEDLILLTEPGGVVSLLRPDLGYRVDVTWDSDALPSCVLWLSNGGRDYAPWDGRVRAIGIEPVAAAFDLGEAHNTSKDTPLARQHVRTAVDLIKGQVWTTEYAISVHQI